MVYTDYSQEDDVSSIINLFNASFELPPLPMEIEFPEADVEIFKPLRHYERQASFLEGEFMVFDFFLHKDPNYNFFYKPLEEIKVERECNLEVIEEEFPVIEQNKIDFPDDDFRFYDDYLNMSNLFYHCKGQIQGIDNILLMSDEDRGFNYPMIEHHFKILEVNKFNLNGKKQAYLIDIGKKKDLKQIFKIFEGFAKAQEDLQDIFSYKGFKTEESALTARHENNKIQAYCAGFLGEIKNLYPSIFYAKREELSVRLVKAMIAKSRDKVREG